MPSVTWGPSPWATPTFQTGRKLCGWREGVPGAAPSRRQVRRALTGWVAGDHGWARLTEAMRGPGEVFALRVND